MDLQNKLIVEKRISEKGPYIEGIKGNKINISVFDENDELKTHDVYFSYE